MPGAPPFGGVSDWLDTSRDTWLTVILGFVKNSWARSRSRPTLRRLLLLALTTTGLGIAGVNGLQGWRYRSELARADRELAAGQYRSALARFDTLAALTPGRAEVEYSRGVCAAALGNVDGALMAWGRVPRDSPLGPRAILDRARLAFEHGRLAIAEASVNLLLADLGEMGRAGDEPG